MIHQGFNFGFHPKEHEEVDVEPIVIVTFALISYSYLMLASLNAE